MTELEEKSIKTQIELLKGIRDADAMILHTIKGTASQILNDIIKPKMLIRDKQAIVELSVEEFNRIRVALTQLSSDEGFGEMNSWIREKCIETKKEKQRILSMLQ